MNARMLLKICSTITAVSASKINITYKDILFKRIRLRFHLFSSIWISYSLYLSINVKWSSVMIMQRRSEGNISSKDLLLNIPNENINLIKKRISIQPSLSMCLQEHKRTVLHIVFPKDLKDFVDFFCRGQKDYRNIIKSWPLTICTDQYDLRLLT